MVALVALAIVIASLALIIVIVTWQTGQFHLTVIYVTLGIYLERAFAVGNTE